MFPRPALLLVAIALLAPTAAGEDTPSFAPRAVAAFNGDPAGAIVAWVPGESPADSYRIYGVNPGGAPALLLDTATAETPGAIATVPSGFATYGVSGVRGESESPLVLAVGSATTSGDCIISVAPPPDPYIIVCDRPPPLVKLNDLPIP